MLRRLGLGMALALHMTGCSSGTPFKDKSGAYSIAFPKGWVAEEQFANNIEWVTARSPLEKEGDPYLENIQITYNQKASKTALNDYLPEMLRFMKEKYAEVNVEEIGSTTLAGQEAKWVLFTAKGPGEGSETMSLKAIHYILVADNHLMIILCVAPADRFDEWKPSFEKSLETLQFHS